MEWNKRHLTISLLIVLIIFLSGCKESDNKQLYLVDIKIDYLRSDGLTYRDDTVILIDGEERGELKYADSKDLTIFLTEGTHYFWLEKDTFFRKTSTNKIKFTVGENYTNSLEINAKENTIIGLKIELIVDSEKE